MLRRYKKSHTEEEFMTHQEQMLDKVMKGVEFYLAFDKRVFKWGYQYRHLEKLREKSERIL